MYITVNLDEEFSKQMGEYIKDKLPEMIKQELFENEYRLRELINQCVKGHIKVMINDITKENEFRTFLRDRIMEYMGMNGDNNEHI